MIGCHDIEAVAWIDMVHAFDIAFEVYLMKTARYL